MAHTWAQTDESFTALQENTAAEWEDTEASLLWSFTMCLHHYISTI